MTVIVTDGKAMAADSRVTGADGSLLTDAGRKLFHAPDGSAVGASGDAASCELVKEWFDKGADPECFPGSLDEDLDVLILRPDGTVQWMDRKCAPVTLTAPAATGCGADYALGALAIGADLRWAVEVAIAHNVNCGGKVQLLQPKEPTDASA